jgi:hypothetical protein
LDAESALCVNPVLGKFYARRVRKSTNESTVRKIDRSHIHPIAGTDAVSEPRQTGRGTFLMASVATQVATATINLG